MACSAAPRFPPCSSPSAGRSAALPGPGASGAGVLFCLFVFYFAGVLSVTGAGTLWDLLHRGWSFSGGPAEPCALRLTPVLVGFSAQHSALRPAGIFDSDALARPMAGAACRRLRRRLLPRDRVQPAAQQPDHRPRRPRRQRARCAGGRAGRGASAAGLLQNSSRSRKKCPRPCPLSRGGVPRPVLLFDELRAAGWLYGF